MFYVKVCATSANLCVGFDVLGLPLDLSNLFWFNVKDDFSFVGFEEEYSKKETNLVYKSYAKVFEKLNEPILPVEIGFQGNIPIERGLGSSSSLVVAGVFAANHILKDRLTKDELFNICCEIEGHPDNVAPAIYGGLTASYSVGNKYKAISYPINKKIKFFVVIPNYAVSTQMARKILPKAISYSDAVNNLSRIIHIPKAFENGDMEWLYELFQDCLHEPYRAKLISEYESIKKICQEEHLPFAISGSGSTMIIFATDAKKVSKLESMVNIKTLELGTGVELWEENKNE